jgi:hypothetical protein
MKAKTNNCLCDDNSMVTVLSVEVFDGGERPASSSGLLFLRKVPGFLSTEGRFLADREWIIQGRQKEPEGCHTKKPNTM